MRFNKRLHDVRRFGRRSGRGCGKGRQKGNEKCWGFHVFRVARVFVGRKWKQQISHEHRKVAVGNPKVPVAQSSRDCQSFWRQGFTQTTSSLRRLSNSGDSRRFALAHLPALDQCCKWTGGIHVLIFSANRFRGFLYQRQTHVHSIRANDASPLSRTVEYQIHGMAATFLYLRSVVNGGAVRYHPAPIFDDRPIPQGFNPCAGLRHLFPP